MPRAPKRCSPSCPKKVVAKGKCEDHQPVRIPWEKSEDSVDRSYWKSAEGQRQRRRVLYRDNTFRGGCQLKLEGCTSVAVEVDHIIPVWYTRQDEVEDEDLQGLCSSCHGKKTSYEGVQAKKIKRIQREN